MISMDEKEYTKSLDLKIWKRLFPMLRRYRKPFALLLIFNTICATFDVLLPLLQRYAVSTYIEGQTLEGIFSFGLFYVLCLFLQALSVVAFNQCSMKIDISLGRELREKLFRHLQTLSLSFYNVTPVGYLLSRLTGDNDRISTMLAWNLADIFWSVFYVLGSFVAMFFLDWKLALVVAVIVPVIAMLTWFFQEKILHWNRKVRKMSSKITGAFNEGITGAKTSKTLVIEEQNTKQFQNLTAQLRHSGIRAARLNAVYIPLVLFLSTMAVAIVLLRGGHLVLQQALDIATLSAFLNYALGIFEPIQMTAQDIAEFISLQASIERVTDLMEQVPQICDTPEVIEKYGDAFCPRKENWEELVGDIEFRNVTFRYPDGGENVLENFSLHIPAGTTVAIVGETGAGKSTLVNLACRFFEPTQGTILVDGVDYRCRSQLWLHSNIGYVLQNPHLFSGSVRENIRYGRLDATDEEIEAAARAVSADVVVAKLEKGWDSEVGEGGDRLSTGEKQLISFARAVLADPKIFVLDEATSSIDTQTEQLIQDAIDHLLRDRTSFLIAHRLSTIRKADLILVVKDGKIVEQGTHLELLQKKGYYHELYIRQFEEEKMTTVLRG